MEKMTGSRILAGTKAPFKSAKLLVFIRIIM